MGYHSMGNLGLGFRAAKNLGITLNPSSSNLKFLNSNPAIRQLPGMTMPCAWHWVQVRPLGLCTLRGLVFEDSDARFRV